MTKLKSRDLLPVKSRCNDQECPCWANDCARAEIWKGLGRFNWLPASVRRAGAKKCARRIDPVSLEERVAVNAG